MFWYGDKIQECTHFQVNRVAAALWASNQTNNKQEQIVINLCRTMITHRHPGCSNRASTYNLERDAKPLEKTQVKMSIRLPGFEWSDAITLPAPRDADTATARNAEEANAHYGAENAATAETARSYAFPGTRTNGRHDAEGYAALTSSTSMSSLDDQQARWHREKATGRGLGSLGIDVAGTVLVHAEFQLRECSRDSDDSNGGASLCVHADVSVPSIGGGVRSVSLWVPYWVVNTTSLSLGFRHDPFALGMVSGNKGRQSPSGAAAAQEEEVIVAPARTTAAVAAAAEANETDGNGTSSTRRTSLASSFSAAGTDRYDGGSGAERREAAVAVAVRGAPVNMANDRHRGSSGGASSPGGGTLSRVEAILGMGANEERLLSLSAAAVEEEGPPGAKFTAVRGGVARRRNSSRHQRSSSPKLFQQPALLGLQHLVEDERATRIIGGGGGISSGGRDEHGREDSRGIEGTARQRELRAEDDDHDPDSTRCCLVFGSSIGGTLNSKFIISFFIYPFFTRRHKAFLLSYQPRTLHVLLSFSLLRF